MRKRTSASFIKSLLGQPTLDFEKFHHKTKMSIKPRQVPEKDWPVSWKRLYFKDYPRLDKITFPKPQASGLTLEKALRKRHSQRDFSSRKINITQLGNLLYFSGGVNFKFRRFYPSAGARYPLEIYVVSIDSELPQGIYHYSPRTHALDILFQDEIDPSTFLTAETPKNVSFFIAFGAVFQRATIKYGNRGYRHILSESGHIAQNFYLNCTAYDIACYSIGGYMDDKINELIDLDETEESIIYLIAVGNN